MYVCVFCVECDCICMITICMNDRQFIVRAVICMSGHQSMEATWHSKFFFFFFSSLMKAIELTGFSVHRSDRTKELTGKSRGGGVCFFINNSWCDEMNLHSIKSFCSPDLEFHMLLCRPFWLPREFTAIIITAVYIPPQANTDQALKELYGNISEQETAYPDAAFIVTGDFNKANFRTIAP